MKFKQFFTKEFKKGFLNKNIPLVVKKVHKKVSKKAIKHNLEVVKHKERNERIRRFLQKKNTTK